MRDPKKLVIAVAVALSIVLLFASSARGKNNGTGAVCPHGNVKWETDGGYEYTDGSAFVTGNADQITVTAAAGYTVTDVCVKIGGPGGGSLTGGNSSGTYGPYEYGISHVVVTTIPDDIPPPDTPEEEGWSKITKTPITCPVCEGEEPLEVLELGDKPVAWDYREEPCFSILIERGIGTKDYSSITKTACKSNGSIVVVAPSGMTIFGDVFGYSTSQALSPDHTIVVNGKEYDVYYTNYNAYADENGNGKADWHEKLKHNWWKGLWQYEQFCCAGFPIIDTDEGPAIIKLPRICFNGVQLALLEAGHEITDEQMVQLAENYVASEYGDIILVP